MSILPTPTADDLERARRLLFGASPGAIKDTDGGLITVGELARAFASLREEVRKEVWNRKIQA